MGRHRALHSRDHTVVVCEGNVLEFPLPELRPRETRTHVQYDQLKDRIPELNTFLAQHNKMLATVLHQSLVTWTAVLVASFIAPSLPEMLRLFLPLLMMVPCWILAGFHQAAVLMTRDELLLVTHLTQTRKGVHPTSLEDLDFALGGVPPFRRRVRYMLVALFCTIRFYVYFFTLAAVTILAHASVWVPLLRP